MSLCISEFRGLNSLHYDEKLDEKSIYLFIVFCDLVE